MTDSRATPAPPRSPFAASMAKVRGVVCRCATVLAVGYVALAFLSHRGFVDWKRVHRDLPAPWNALFHPNVGPDSALLLGVCGLGYLLLSAMAWVLVGPTASPGTVTSAAPRSILRGRLDHVRRCVNIVLGDGTAIVVRRLASFAWLVVFVCLYLIVNRHETYGAAPPYAAMVDPASGPQLAVAIVFYPGDDGIILTMPVLASMAFFGLATLAAAPRPGRRYLPWPIALIAGTAPLVVAFGATVALDRVMDPDPRPWSDHEPYTRLVEMTLLSVPVAYLLAALEACLADVGSLRPAWARHRLLAVPVAGRAMARLSVSLAPVAVGLWLAVDYLPPASSIATDRHGRYLALRNAVDNSISIPVNDFEIAPVMRDAMQIAEDPGFEAEGRTHSPVNPVRVAGAMQGIVSMLQNEGGVSGASGIAAQSCKHVFGRPLSTRAWLVSERVPSLGFLRSLPYMGARGLEKLAETPCAWTFEKVSLYRDRGTQSALTKYLGTVTFLHVNDPVWCPGDPPVERAYDVRGVGAAAVVVFGKDAGSLTLAEAAALAGMPNQPGYLNPWCNPDAVIERRNWILSQMVRAGYSAAEIEEAKREPLGNLARPQIPTVLAAHFIEAAMGEVGTHDLGRISTSAYQITTTLDRDAQDALELAVALTVESQTAGNVNDGAAILIHPRTGDVLAYVGGVRSPVGKDAALDILADQPVQPGSTIKPFVYACAMEYGFLDQDGTLHAPRDRGDIPAFKDSPGIGAALGVGNWDGEFVGDMSPAEALIQSRNVPAAYLVWLMTPDVFAQCLHDVFGIESDLRPERYGARLGIGVFEITLEELARAYAVLANGGRATEPAKVLRVADRDGRELYARTPPERPRVLSCATSRWVASVLEEAARRWGGLPAGFAAKTGTTETTSAIAGFTRDRVMVGWVGHLEPKASPGPIDSEVASAGAILREMSAGYLGEDEAASSIRCGSSDFRAEPPAAKRSRAVPPAVPVLLYHAIDDGEGRYSIGRRALERQLGWLRQNGYESITPRQLFDALETGRPLPEKVVMLTIDDGSDDSLLFAELLADYGFRGTFFVPTASDLTERDIKRLAKTGEVCGHTVSHPRLPDLPRAAQRAEIVDNKRWLEEVVGLSLTCFAYPYGEFDETTAELVTAAGYVLAFDAWGPVGRLDAGLDRKHIPGTEIGGGWTRRDVGDFFALIA